MTRTKTALVILSTILGVVSFGAYTGYYDGFFDNVLVKNQIDIQGTATLTGTFNTDTLDADEHLNVDGTSQFDGRVDFDGSVDIGNSATNDTVFFTSRIGSDIDPTATDTYAFGSNSLRWDYWGGDLNISDSTVLGGTVDVTGATALNGAVTFGSTIGAGADAFPDTTIDYAEECSTFIDGSFVNDDELASNDTTNWGVMADTALVYADAVRGELTDSVTAIVYATVWDSLKAGWIRVETSYAQDYYGYDVSQADTFHIWDDGDTTRFESDNPIKIGESSLIVGLDGTVTITGRIESGSAEYSGVWIYDSLVYTVDTNYTSTDTATAGATDTVCMDCTAYGTNINTVLVTANDGWTIDTIVVSGAESFTCGSSLTWLAEGAKEKGAFGFCTGDPPPSDTLFLYVSRDACVAPVTDSFAAVWDSTGLSLSYLCESDPSWAEIEGLNCIDVNRKLMRVWRDDFGRTIETIIDTSAEGCE